MKFLDYKTIFIIDGIGALVSSIFLGFVLIYFQPWVGMPASTLCFLAFFPLIFFMYDLYCITQIRKYNQAYLMVIGCANIGYCLISTFCLVEHFQIITALGKIYFIIEVTLVLSIGFYELKANNYHLSNQATA